MIIKNENDSNEKLLQSGFYKNRLTGYSNYNYDIFPLIKDFDFYTFIDYAEKHKKNITDYGGFIVITSKQYIIGYNENFGTGTHLMSLARVAKEITGGGTIKDKEEAKNLANYCFDKYIVASIVYECIEEYGVPKCSGYISFEINENNISEEIFESFEQFYYEYNKEIERVIKKYGIEKFSVVLNIKQNGKLKKVISYSLDDLYNYLKENINYNIDKLPNDEIIIGNARKSKYLTLQ